jgi:hypothetical protein
MICTRRRLFKHPLSRNESQNLFISRTKLGITRHFMKELAGTLIPGGSALFVLVRRPVAGQGEGAERNRRQNLEDLGFARGRGQTAGCFECGEIVKSCLRRLPFKDDEALARILHVTGDDRLGTTAIYLNLIDLHVVDEYTQEVVKDHSRVSSRLEILD